ncbi:MAG: hypothetical protein II266_05025 [Clostridia bacterium]|nr:hypothetical protein [Clostridia bacterium]
MIKKLISGAFFALLLAAGLFLPNIIAKISDLRIETDPVYTAFCPAEEFSYIGTPEDKLRALTHYENMSVDYKITPKTDWQTVKTLPEGVQALFPDLGSGEIRERTFTLTHKSVSVNFTYTETELHANGGSVRILSDPESDKILLLSITNAQNAIKNWENTKKYDSEGFLSVTGIDAYALLRMFANINGFAEISDLTDGNSYGGSVSTVKADVKAHPYSLSLTFSEDAGTIFYRLIQVENN